MSTLDGTDDVFDSRDVGERIDALISDWEDSTGDTFSDFALSTDDYAVGLGEDDAEELAALIAFRDEVSEYTYSGAFRDGITFIRDSYFEDYARELADDKGATDPKATWPLNFIDWESAADALKDDYTSYTFMGTEYWGRD